MAALERWVQIEAAPNYAVSNLGRVKRLTPGPGTAPGRLKSPSYSAYGYLVVNLVTNGVRRVHAVHRLVCIAFHGAPPTSKHEAAHEDGDKDNCREDNLSWKLSLANAADRMRHGNNRSPGQKLTVAQVRAIRIDDRPQRQIAAQYGVMPMHISRIKTGARRGQI